jgi:hypothetical protein
MSFPIWLSSAAESSGLWTYLSLLSDGMRIVA